MENKINIAELLKDCPKGMPLDCTMFENVTFVRVDNGRKQFPIEIAVSGMRSKYLTKEGCFHDNTLLPEAKCVIFPKGKTTWKGFKPPCLFKDGDIIADNSFGTICIFKGEGSIKGTVDYYCGINDSGELFVKDIKDRDEHFGEIDGYNFATEEEKQKLFDIIKANGYKWNEETKTLEKLVEPKFKVGDRIKLNNSRFIYTITDLLKDRYRATVDSNDLYEIEFERQDAYKLVPDKFDITTLKPLESKVLMRSSNAREWVGTIFSHYSNNKFYGCGMYCDQCIPYEGNEHLLGTTNDCDNFYKTWE